MRRVTDHNAAPPDRPPGLRDHFIPFRRGDVVDMCLQREGLDETGRERFRDLARVLGAFFHFEFQGSLHRLADSYTPFDPDRDTHPIRKLSAPEQEESLRDLVDGLREVLRRANYVRVTDAEIHQAMEEESVFRIRLHVDPDDFEKTLIFRRGETLRRETVRRLIRIRLLELNEAPDRHDAVRDQLRHLILDQ